MKWRKYPDENPDDRTCCMAAFYYDGSFKFIMEGYFNYNSKEFEGSDGISEISFRFLRYWIPLEELEATLPKEEQEEDRCVECGGPQYIYVSDTTKKLLCKECHNKWMGIGDCFVCNQPVYPEEELKTYSPPRVHHLKCFLSYEIEGIHKKLDEQQRWLSTIYVNLPNKPVTYKYHNGRPYCKKCGYFHIEPTTSCYYDNTIL